MSYRISPLGDAALIIEFGSEISERLNKRVLKLSRFFDKNPFRGLLEIVPAYASLACFYDISTVRKNFSEFPTAFAAVQNLTEKALQNTDDFAEPETRLIEIPVSFDSRHALDLKANALKTNLSPEEFINIFLSKIYRVYMLGFLPGFAYMGEIDERIAVPRKQTPRLKVPQGSVGIAGKQTGIYSLESPGGWQVIGKTNIEIFTPDAEKATLLQPGDSVKFYEVTF